MSEPRSNLKRALVKLRRMEARLEAAEGRRHEPLAVVGVGCRFPAGADSPEALWRVLRDGVDGVGTMPPERWPYREAPPVGGFLAAVDGFDAPFFGISPREAATLDPQQRLLLEVAWEALEDAGLSAEALAGSAGGVFAGLYNNDYRLLHLADPAAVDIYSGTGTIHGLAANRLSYLLDLRGPSLAVDTTCSSSLVALHLACRALRAGDCDVALAAGVNLVLAPVSMRSAELLVPPAADRRCKAFDAAGDGIVRGEGCGVVVLKRLADVVPGDRVRAIVRGTAVNQDGRSNGLTAPNPEAQREVIRRALADGRVAAGDLSYAEAHGTGTPLGDPIELEALEAELAVDRRPGETCRVGSVKTNFGHLEAAAGIAGLIKTVLALEQREIPPQLHFERLNPEISLQEDVLEIARQGMPWEAADGRPRRAGVAAFSIGGTNAYAVLEEAVPVPPTRTTDAATPAVRLLPLSAKTPQALRAAAEALAPRLSQAEGEDLDDILYTVASRRTAHRHRAVVTGRDGASLARSLESFAATGDGLTGEASEGLGGRVFVYSGQGGQRAAMGQALLASQPVFQEAFERCDAIFQRLLGQSPVEEIARSPETSRLDRTAVGQPAQFSLQVALTELWRSWGVTPDAVVGHSLGEAAAAWACGALDLEAAARVVAERSRRMARLEGRGAMLAVELSAAEAAEWQGPGVRLAALNGPRSTVLSGDPPAVAECRRQLTERGVRCRELAVRCAFHSHQVEPLRDELAAALGDFASGPARLPFVSTVSGGELSGEQLDASYWAANLADPVHFAPAVEHLLSQGYATFLEIGPHPSLAADLAAQAAAVAASPRIVGCLRRGVDDDLALVQAVAKLWISGEAVDWRRLAPTGRVTSLPAYPWQRQRHWLPESPAGSTAAAAPATRDEPFAVRSLGTAVPLFGVTWSGPLFADHRIAGEALVPASVVLEAVRAAAGFETGSLRDLSFERPLVVPEDGVLEGQIHLGDGFEVFGRSTGGGWSRHLSGRIESSESTPGESTPGESTPGEFTPSESTPGESTPGESTPGEFTPSESTPGDQSLAALRRAFAADEDTQAVAVDEFYEALAEGGVALGPRLRAVIALERRPGEVLAQIRQPSMAPTVGPLRPVVLDACLQPLAALWPERRCLLVAVDRLDLEAPLPEEVWSHLRARETAGGLRAEVAVFAADGRRLLRAEGLHFRDYRPHDKAVDAQLLELAWRSVAVPRTPQPAGLLATLDSAADLAADLAPYGELVPAVDAVCADYARQAVTAVAAVEPSRQALYQHLLGLAREAPEGSPPTRLAELRRRFPRHRAELDLLERCGEGLAAVLAGERDPLELLFPGGSLGDAEEVYGTSPFAVAFNQAARRVVEAWVAQRGERPLRALEIGAGTGATTAALLEVLPAEGLDYCFTDIGPLFLQRAAERFAAHRGLRFAPFDVESDAPPAGAFDLVVASNVLHATADLRQTLERVEACLADDGLLLLIEGTPGQRWADLTFGLTDGWWRHRDRDLRPDHPLLPPQRWRELLARVGFEDAVAWTGAPALPEAALLLARRRRRPRGDWLLLGGDGACEAAFATTLGAAGARLSRGGLDEASAVADWAAAVDHPEGWLLVAPEGDSAADVLERATQLSATVLAGVQGLAAARLTQMPKLWLVSRRGESPSQADGDDSEVAPVGSLLGGLGTALAAEHRELWGGLVEVEAADGGPASDDVFKPAAERWLAELRLASGERWRLGGEEARVPTWCSRPLPAQTLEVRSQATYLVTGGTGGMGQEVVRWLLAEGAGRVVAASRGGGEDERAGRLLETLDDAARRRLAVVGLDVAEEAAVAGLVAELASGELPLAGIFHAAGVFDDRTLVAQDRRRFARVLAPKVAGAWNLHRASRRLDLDCFVLFSSAVTLLPMAGLSNYTAANAFLGGLAEHRRRRGLPAVAIEWGGWDRVGMARAVGEQRQDQWRRLGLEPLSVDTGLAVLAAAPAWPSARLAALEVDWRRLAAALPTGLPAELEGLAAELAEPASSPAFVARPAVDDWLTSWRGALAGERRELMAERVQREAARVMMLPAGEALDRRSALSELGLDSLMAVELRNGLAGALAIELPATVLFDHPSVAALADHLCDLLSRDDDGSPSPGGKPSAAAADDDDDADELAEVMAALDDLPEAELRAVLASVEEGNPGIGGAGDD